MATRSFDTYRTVKVLVEAGFDESQAEAVVDAVGNAMGEGELATKSDLKELESRMTVKFMWMMIGSVSITTALLSLIIGIMLQSLSRTHTDGCKASLRT